MATSDRAKAVSKLASVWAVPRKCPPGLTSPMALMACPFSDMSTPSTNVAARLHWSASMMNFS